MPVIKSYDASVDLNPTNHGVEATAAAARRVGTYYDSAANSIKEVGRDAGKVVQGAVDLAYSHMENRELSRGAAELATMHENLTKAWNDRAKNADPNDPSVAQKFREDTLEPTLEGFSQRFVTSGAQKWAQARVASTREHMVTKASGDMATLAGNAVAINTAATINSLSNTVRSDPSSLEESLKIWETSFETAIASSPGLSGVQVSNMRKTLLETGRGEIVKSAFVGMAQVDPERAMKLAQDPANPWAKHLSGSDVKSIIANAKQQQRASQLDAKQAEALRKLEATQASEEAESATMKLLHSDNPIEKQQVTARSIVNDDRLSNQAKRTLLGMMERDQKPEPAAAVSRATSRDLFARITADPDSPTKLKDIRDIDQAFIDEKLTRTDHDWLRKQFLESRTPEGQRLDTDRTEFFRRYAASIDGAMDYTGHSALGSQKIYEAQIAARRLEADLRKKNLDPHLVYDPSSEYFFGRPENISRYRVSLTDVMRARTPAATPPKPGAPPEPAPAPKFERASQLPPGAKLEADGFYYFERDGQRYRLRPVQ